MSADLRCTSETDGLGRCERDAGHKGQHAYEHVPGPPGPPPRWDTLTEIPDTSTKVQLPAEPCVVIWDGEGRAVVATERTCLELQQWASWSGPVARVVMAARLRALADLIDTSDGDA